MADKEKEQAAVKSKLHQEKDKENYNFHNPYWVHNCYCGF